MKKALSVITLVILADQALKIWVKLNMRYNQSISIMGDHGFLHFIENPGMAFGLEFGGDVGKLLLSLFRVAVLIGLGVFMRQQIKAKAHPGLIICLSLIFAGALGNIIDSAVYGLIFSASTPFEAASLFPADGGYASFLHGKVVDMFYFPLFKGTFPSWIPKWGGEDFLFFGPVFNIADSAIAVGVTLLILFQRRFFPKTTDAELEEDVSDVSDNDLVEPSVDTP